MGSLNNSTNETAPCPKGIMTLQATDAVGNSSEPPALLAESSISNDVGFLLAKLHAAGSVLNNAALAEFGLKERSYSVLALACGNLGPTQRELAEFLSLDPSQIVALIDELEERGLVERKPGISDRRQKLVAATAEGRKVHAAAQKATKAAEARHLNMLTTQEVASLRSILRKAVWAENAPTT
jgi:DNA-binding MarR family transcriptional regulator